VGKSGGGVGSALGGVANGVFGPVVGGLTNQVFGANAADRGNRDMARAAQNAALAQQRMAWNQYEYNRGQLDNSRKELQGYTVEALASFDRDIKNQEKNLSRQEQMIANLDPTIIEAAQQALKLMRGETSSTLAPLQRQRDMQRQKLLSSLREQLGPGAETSTAGMQALSRFDSETSNIFASAQQGALGQLGNISGQFSAQRPDMLREIGGLSQFGQGKYGLGLNMANFDLQRINALQGGQASVLGSTGAQYTSDLMRGQFGQMAGIRQQELGAQQQAQGMQMMASVFGGSSGGTAAPKPAASGSGGGSLS
jgi:hypothetical protein